MAIRDRQARWGTRVLGWVEGLGDVLGLALAALMLPVGKLVLWLGQFLLRRLRRLRWRPNQPRPGAVAAPAPKVAAVPKKDERGEQSPGPAPPPAAAGRRQPRGFGWGVGALYVL